MNSSSGGSLFDNLLLFGRMLRQLGLDVDTGRMMDAVQALSAIQIGRREEVRLALRCLLTRRREDLPIFDEAFDRFWTDPSNRWDLLEQKKKAGSRRSRHPIVIPPPLQGADARNEGANPHQHRDGDAPPLVEATLTYSDRERLRQADFSSLTPAEVAAIQHMIAGLTWQLGLRSTRRYQAGDGRRVDLRRTLRGSFIYGGEIVKWARKEPKFRPRPLVILADISGSMERYSRLLLHFVYGVNRGLDSSVEAFVFSTRLTRITRALRERSVDQALWQVSQSVPDWSGGTRIGDALKEFNFCWARRVLGRGAVVLLISDGWDRGDPQVLQEEIARLQRSAHRLIWLNPLLGDPHYEPLARGMRTALPYIDDFLPVYNLASLEELVAHLRRLDETRLPRRAPVRNGTVSDERHPVRS